MAKKSTRKVQDIPKDETKSARFIRVVTPRVSKAVKAINQIGFCSGLSYESKPEQTKQILNALLKAVEVLESKFAGKVGSENTFNFIK